jgi:hypothetical protein
VTRATYKEPLNQQPLHMRIRERLDWLKRVAPGNFERSRYAEDVQGLLSLVDLLRCRLLRGRLDALAAGADLPVPESGQNRTNLPPHCPCGSAWSTIALDGRGVVLVCGQTCEYVVAVE